MCSATFCAISRPPSPGLAPWPILISTPAGSSTMCGIALMIRFQPKWPEAICRIMYLRYAAFEQPHRHAPLARAHAHRQAALLVEVGDGHGHRLPHPPGEGADRHVADDHRVDPVHRRRVAVGLQQPFGADPEGELARRQDAAERRQHVEGVALGVEGRVGHLRDAPDPHPVEGAGRPFQVLAAAALDRVAAQAAGDDRVAGVGVAHRADGVVGADLFADAAAAAVVLDRCGPGGSPAPPRSAASARGNPLRRRPCAAARPWARWRGRSRRRRRSRTGCSGWRRSGSSRADRWR